MAASQNASNSRTSPICEADSFFTEHFFDKDPTPLLSLLPGIACGKTVRQKAWDEASWEDLGTILKTHKDAASYRA